MDLPTKTDRRGLRDWFIITVIILIGFLCLIIAGSMAMRFSPRWQLPSSMDSSIDPNSEYLTRRPQGYIEPLDEAILTPPVWIGFFQTPGASVPQPSPLPTRTIAASTVVVMPTATGPIAATLIPTNTIIYIPVSPTNTAVHIPVSATHTQRPAPSNTATATATATLTATATATATTTVTATPTNTSSEADLTITKDDGVAMYSGGSVLTYTVIVTNNGPANVTGAIITDDFVATHFENWTWKCTAQTGGASGCDDAATNTSNFSDTVDLPNGASIHYTVTALVLKPATGDLVNTAKISGPVTNTDNNTSNNQDSDIDQYLPAASFPMGNVGETKDGVSEVIDPGDSLILRFSTPLVVNGHGGYDLVYYERPNGAGIAMDIVGLEVGDGNNWYRIFYWGDEAADTNSNMDISVIGGSENDNRDFTSPPPGFLYNGTGVLIQLDGVVPPGTYPYIRIISPPAPGYSSGTNIDGGCELDAIAILN